MNRQCLRAVVHLRRATNYNKLPLSLLKNPFHEVKQYRNFTFQLYNQLKFRAVLRFNQYLQTRNNSSNSGGNENKKKTPVLMDFVPVMRPEILRSIKNWILAKFIIQPYLDGDFILKDFTLGAKQALISVSSYLSQGDFQSLQGLVSEDAIKEIKRNFSSLNVKERQDLLVQITDILFAFPFQIGIIFDDNDQKRFAEITVVYHCMNDLENLRAQGKIMVEDVSKDIKICNYRFIREYTKGVKSDWVINRLGHFKVCHFED